MWKYVERYMKCMRNMRCERKIQEKHKKFLTVELQGMVGLGKE